MRPVIVLVVLLTAAAPARADLTREQVLGAYRELEQKLGASPGDPSTALATFMVGCHAAYSGAPFPEDAHFAALRQQVKPQVDAFASIAGSERAKIIEYLAFTGMTFVIHRAALDRSPDAKRAAALREEAGRVLATNKIDPKVLADAMSKLGTAPVVASKPATAPVAPAPSKLDTDAMRKQIAGITITYDRTYDGEYIGYDERTYLMLTNGWASKKLGAAIAPGGLDAHRAANPRDWVQWRGRGGKLEICASSCDVAASWKALRSELMTPSMSAVLPKGFRLAGSYKNVGGGSVGGTTSLRMSFYTFEANGRFSTSSAGAVTVTTHVTGAGDRQIANGGRTSVTVGGNYEIDGVVLTLRYDDGRVDYKTITSDPKPAPKAVTINGTMFNRM